MAEQSDPARVLFIDQSGELGGAELSLLDIVRTRRSELASNDSVALLSGGPFADRLRRAGVGVSMLPLSTGVKKASGLFRQLAAFPSVLVTAWRLASMARTHDLIYANTQKAAVVAALAARLAKRPFVWHLRDMLDAEHFSAANRKVVIGLTNRAASLVLANSQATADAYRRAGGRVEVRVVYNGIDPTPFSKERLGQQLNLRQELGIPDEATLVGAFGRLTPWKGQHVLLQAMSSPSLGYVHAIVVGEALFTDEDRVYAEELHAASQAEPLAGRVHWLGHRDDVPDLMRACDVIVHSAVDPEPFGRVLVEGLLAGIPVIGAAAGGALEILRDGETGLLTTPGDANELADAITALIEYPEEAQRLAEAGRADALERFGLMACVEVVNEAISQVVREHPTHR